MAPLCVKTLVGERADRDGSDRGRELPGLYGLYGLRSAAGRGARRDGLTGLCDSRARSSARLLSSQVLAAILKGAGHEYLVQTISAARCRRPDPAWPEGGAGDEVCV